MTEVRRLATPPLLAHAGGYLPSRGRGKSTKTVTGPVGEAIRSKSSHHGCARSRYTRSALDLHTSQVREAGFTSAECAIRYKRDPSIHRAWSEDLRPTRGRHHFCTLASGRVGRGRVVRQNASPRIHSRSDAPSCCTVHVDRPGLS